MSIGVLFRDREITSAGCRGHGEAGNMDSRAGSNLCRRWRTLMRRESFGHCKVGRGRSGRRGAAAGRWRRLNRTPSAGVARHLFGGLWIALRRLTISECYV